MNRKLISATLGLTALLVAGSANAVFVEEFNYEAIAGWQYEEATCNGADDCVTPSGDMSITVNGENVASKISWGTDIGNGQSALTAWQNDGPGGPGPGDTTEPNGDLTGAGTILTDGSARTITVFRHDNITVADDDNLLTSVPFIEEFTITGPAGFDFSPAATDIIFGIAFFETPNQGGCPDAQQSGTPCDDFFVLLNEEVLNPVVEVCFEGTDDCWDYEFTIMSEGLELVDTDSLLADFGIDLTDAQELLAGDTVGVITTEEAASTDAVFTTTARHIPEPGSMALMGLGLAGLGFSRRRRNAA